MPFLSFFVSPHSSLSQFSFSRVHANTQLGHDQAQSFRPPRPRDWRRAARAHATTTQVALNLEGDGSRSSCPHHLGLLKGCAEHKTEIPSLGVQGQLCRRTLPSMWQREVAARAAAQTVRRFFALPSSMMTSQRIWASASSRNSSGSEGSV